MNPFKRTSRAAVRAFTILEMMVVLIIIALLASIVVPRFSGMGRREFNLVVDQVVDMMTMYAQREQLEQRTVGLLYEPERHELQLLLLRQETEGVNLVEWMIDPYVPPVELPADVVLLAVTADGDDVDIADFALSSSPMEPRPTISIVLQGSSDTATITLPSHGITPETSGTSIGGRRFNAAPESLDLDGAGRAREDW